MPFPQLMGHGHRGRLRLWAAHSCFPFLQRRRSVPPGLKARVHLRQVNKSCLWAHPPHCHMPPFPHGPSQRAAAPQPRPMNQNKAAGSNMLVWAAGIPQATLHVTNGWHAALGCWHCTHRREQARPIQHSRLQEPQRLLGTSCPTGFPR